MNWIESIARYNKRNSPYVLVTVLKVQGSTPRDTDAKMVVGLEATYDSIGGGRLEFEAVKAARELLDVGARVVTTQSYNLSQDVQQCCGGKVELLFECFPARQFEVVVFGAGHVGTALIDILKQVPCRVSWLDSRPDYLPASINDHLPWHIQTSVMSSPEQTIESCGPGAWYIVMTHSHALDQQLVEAILSRGDAQFCGLIGSKSKAARFRSRLKRKGFSPEELAQLSSPIGLQGISGKAPMEIAVSVAAQILQLRSLAMAMPEG